MPTMRYPKITIVTQCWNREKYIAETIESVLSQGYPNLEYIVIDDNSSDKSWEIIQRYKDKLAYCERLNFTPPSHAYSCNYGFSKGSGEIMTWLLSKDVFLPKSLFTVAEVFIKFPHIEWITGMGAIIDGDGKIIRVTPIRKDRYEHLVGVPWNIQQESTFWRQSLWERTSAQCNEDVVAIDMNLWMTKFFPHARLYHLNTLLGAYRKTPSISFSTIRRKKFTEDIEEARKIMRKLVSRADLWYALLYRILRYIKPILRNIPDGIYVRIPILNKLSHKALDFRIMEDNRGVLSEYDRNPFRTIFPWWLLVEHYRKILIDEIFFFVSVISPVYRFILHNNMRNITEI